MRFHLSLVLLIALMLSACTNEELDSESITDLEATSDAIESSINTVSGIADDIEGESVVASTPLYWKVQQALHHLFTPQAFASGICSRSLTDEGGGVCSRELNCSFGAYSWSGSIELNFSSGTCQSLSDGESVTRTTSFIRSARRGTVTTTGNTTLTRNTSSDYDVTISSISKVITNARGVTVLDASVSTPDGNPLNITGLSRATRTVNGTVQVLHNLLGATFTKTYTNVSYSADCCYPTSGTITGNWQGDRTGEFTATFNGCGEVDITIDGETESETLENCE